MFHLIGFKYQTSHSNFVKIFPIHKWTCSLKRNSASPENKTRRNLNSWQTTENLLILSSATTVCISFQIKDFNSIADQRTVTSTRMCDTWTERVEILICNTYIH